MHPKHTTIAIFRALMVPAVLLAAPLARAADTNASDANSARGIVKAISEATITSTIGERIQSLPFRDGQEFKADDVLVKFDCERLRADLRAAVAEHKGFEATYQSNVTLNRLHAAGSNDVKVSRANADKSQATADGLQARIKECELHAPFAGRVAELDMHEFEIPSPGSPILKIVDDKHLEVEVIVPSKWLKFLKIGLPFQFRLQETGNSYKGTVSRISGVVDPVSQTVKVVGAPAAIDDTIRPGMSIVAQFDTNGQ
ncbi:MAG: efflux RND transporter periplasmic adaptor subunit [Hyphomicrobiales bacterium]|nr:efflux RND transporter periplasmic adaptor subunit [Hyphomicrobiales bacterium]MDE2116145.1 efflux RND transporter periplasmic adaptor subunit [Hyphomicrobiales bacterium]